MSKEHLRPLTAPLKSPDTDVFDGIRRTRLMQLCAATAVGLCASLLVAKNTAFLIFSLGLACLLLAYWFAFLNKIQASAYTLLSSLATMLFALSYTGAGIFDLAILGYPGLLIFAAILGGVGLFSTVLVFVVTLCILITSLTINGFITPHVPTLSWVHLVFILVIFIVTAFSVYILVRDIKHLTISLQQENSEVQISRRKIQHLARHDPLTNLPNRFFGERLFQQALAKCQENNLTLVLIFIDLDNFKPVNDALGHEAGDQLLEQLAKRLRSTLKPDQHLIRFGGDEFLILTPSTGERLHISRVAELLIEQCASVFNILRTQVVLSASMGIACAPDDGTDFKQLCRKADIAMYQAKQDGRNTFHFYNDQLDQDSNDKFSLLQRLRPAFEDRQFILFYQPLIDLASDSVESVEALIRWQQDCGTLLGPDNFIPLAESNGFINELGNWVIQEACSFCAKQRKLGLPHLRVAVNLSAIQFKDRQLLGNVENALAIAKLPPQALELELTESLLINETDQIQQQLSALTKMGVSIAIDDFGTGYSNLGYLRDFQASKLKIDRSFITSLCSESRDEPLVAAIINMASSLGMKTVAEGIENKQTLNKLRALGCDYGQGYYWSKPVSEQEFEQTLLTMQATLS